MIYDALQLLKLVFLIRACCVPKSENCNNFPIFASNKHPDMTKEEEVSMKLAEQLLFLIIQLFRLNIPFPNANILMPEIAKF